MDGPTESELAELDALKTSGTWTIFGRDLKVTNLQRRTGQRVLAQKTAGARPEWLARWDNPEADPGETHTYLVVDEPAAAASRSGYPSPPARTSTPPARWSSSCPARSAQWYPNGSAAVGAPVSAPIGWEELDDSELSPDGFTVRTVLPRIAERGDLFRDLLHARERLPKLR